MYVFTPVMTAADAPSPFVVSASSAFGGFVAWKALDWIPGDGAGWLANATTGWIKIDCGAAIAITGYSLIGGFGYATTSPNDWVLEGSNDDSSWTTLDTQTDITSWASGTPKTYTLAAEASYRYYRITISENNGHASYCGIGEWLFVRPTPLTGGGFPLGAVRKLMKRT